MKWTAVVFVLAVVAGMVQGQEFKTIGEREECFAACQTSVGKCLEPDQACQGVFETCMEEDNFVGCLQSANSLMIQDVLACFDSSCFRQGPSDIDENTPPLEQEDETPSN